MQHFGFFATRDEVEAIEKGYRAFNHFDATHIALIALAAAVIAGAVFVYRRLSTEGKNRFLTVLTVLLLLDELAKYAIALGTDSWYWGYLPLHLCSINIFICLTYTVTKKDFFCGDSLLSLPARRSNSPVCSDMERFAHT